MRYLLVGNGESDNVAEMAANADIVIQINTCRHAACVPEGLTKYVFLVNTGDLIKGIAANLPVPYLSGATIILGRNPAFYIMKRSLLRILRIRENHLFRVSILPALPFPVKAVSFLSALRLDYKLLELGMPLDWMPSTGMVAYDWICRRMRKGDSLAMTGFTFEGWERHPWHIERNLVKSIIPVARPEST